MNFFQAEKGGSGGVNNYPDLSNKPQINGVVIEGSLSFTDLGLNNIVINCGTSTTVLGE